MVIGITGTHGAGKGAVVQYLKEKGFIHCSARELFLDVIAQRGGATDRAGIRDVANTLRKEHGPAYVVEEYVRRFDPVTNDIVVESIYTCAEAEAIRLHGGYVIAVDADPKVRYERIKHRMSETDFVTEEEFIKLQEQELASDDPNKQNARAVMAEADFTITNNDSFEVLKIEVDTILDRILGV